MRVRVFKTRDFARFARKENIEDSSLCAAIFRAERGVIDADLTGGLIKQRVPRHGRGRSGGFRTVIAYRHADRAFFVYGFAKSARDNIEADDLKRLKVVAAALLNLGKVELKTAITEQKILEVICDGKKI
jgi:hypothetical protein